MNSDLREISDGKLYGPKDMVKTGCRDCAGCSDCCRGMGDSVVLDPYDIFRLSAHLGQTFEEMLSGPVELHVEDGLILPNLKMREDGDGPCVFLDEEGRCSIHPHRPGLCRLFPLGRNYEEGEIRYFLLRQACSAKNRSKVRVEKWLDTERLQEYEKFLITWHGFTKCLREALAGYAADEAKRGLNLAFLRLFYTAPYTKPDFYGEFRERLEEGRANLF